MVLVDNKICLDADDVKVKIIRIHAHISITAWNNLFKFLCDGSEYAFILF